MDLSLEERIARIETRNERVEREKAWEVSWTRFGVNVLATYLVMNLLLFSIGGPFPPVHALVPTAGYILSTLSIPVVKRRWLERCRSTSSGKNSGES